MDIHVLHVNYFDDEDKIRYKPGFFISLVHIIIAIYAFSLSWSCSINYSLPIRIIFGFLAALFGGLYVLMFIIMRLDLCNIRSMVDKVSTKPV